MIKFLCLIVFIASALAAEIESERIIGGHNARRGQFPFQVSLREMRNRHFCGGTLIAHRFVLTAAHCMQGLQGDPRRTHLVVGATRLASDSAARYYSVDKVISHPHFNRTTMANDIAVLRTTKNITFTSHIQPIALPWSDVPPNGKFPLTVSGWGQFRVSSHFQQNYAI